MDQRFLQYSQSVSRGRETYGYNIIKLTDTTTGKTYKTCGGGYDMLGTVLAEWMGDNIQRNLHEYLTFKSMQPGDYCTSGMTAEEKGWPYGCSIGKDSNMAWMDGAVGQSSVTKILEAIGCVVQSSGYTKGKKYIFTGFNITMPHPEWRPE